MTLFEVKISLWTHKINDVSLNDFIFAAAINVAAAPVLVPK